MAHIRRKFYDIMEATQSPIAVEALQRIAPFYEIEKEIRSRTPGERRQVRYTRSRLLMDSMHEWLATTLSKLPRKSETAAAIHCALSRWDALLRYLDDGRIELDNLIAERALRPVAVGPKKLPVRRFGQRRSQAAIVFVSWVGKDERPRPQGVPAPCARPHRRTSDQPHRGTAAMERRRKPVARKPDRRLVQSASDEQDPVTLPLPHIAELVADGKSPSVKCIRSGCVAVVP